jgi:hypothetical protein
LEAIESTEKYKAQSTHYLENAFKFIKSGDAEKTGEFLWGSVAEALKAVAASKGIELKAYWEIGDYARKLAKELRDETILNAFRDASYLHSNFYEAGLTMEEVYTYAERIRATVGKLLSLIPEKGQTKGS